MAIRGACSDRNQKKKNSSQWTTGRLNDWHESETEPSSFSKYFYNHYYTKVPKTLIKFPLVIRFPETVFSSMSDFAHPNSSGTDVKLSWSAGIYSSFLDRLNDLYFVKTLSRWIIHFLHSRPFVHISVKVYVIYSTLDFSICLMQLHAIRTQYLIHLTMLLLYKYMLWIVKYEILFANSNEIMRKYIPNEFT